MKVTTMSESNRTGLNRFYLHNFPDQRPVVWGDLGSELRIAGVLFQGRGTDLIALLPGGQDPTPGLILDVIHPTAEEWSDIIRQTDNPEIFVLDVDGHTKVLQRKAANAVSGEVQQAIWARDDCACVFCGRRMGEAHVVLSIDHWVPLELGGKNEWRNYLTACTRCNKNKGSMEPRDFCRKFGFDYDAVEAYRKQVNGEN